MSSAINKVRLSVSPGGIASQRSAPAKGVPGDPVTNDPFLGVPGDAPEEAQWGHHIASVPEAWSLALGHARIGLVDTGLEVEHEELRAFSQGPDGELIYNAGPFREHLSADFLANNLDCNVDERDPSDPTTSEYAGHGTHISGIVAAKANNESGGTGVCRGCSLAMARTFPVQNCETLSDCNTAALQDVAEGIYFLMEQGVQIISMSFGLFDPSSAPISCTAGDSGQLGLFCNFLSFAEERDVLLYASSGNDLDVVEFPARDPRVVAVGGLQYDNTQGFVPWDIPAHGGECPLDGTQECGSSFGPEQELTAAAAAVISSMYTGYDHNPGLGCGDSVLPNPQDPDMNLDGYGLCTGTSMSSPYVAGIAGLVRTVNPLLTAPEIRDIMNSTASGNGAWDERLGWGAPHAKDAVEKVLGQSGGQLLPNRLTPLFALANDQVKAHAYTTSPQQASSLIFDSDFSFGSVGSMVNEYPQFPGTGCVVSPCSSLPRADIYVFTTPSSPFPGAPPLVPLAGMLYDPNLPARCDPGFEIEPLRDYAVTTSVAGILSFKQATDANGVGYEYSGVEGYIFGLGSVPEGAERVARLYHPGRDEHILALEPDIESWYALGYEAEVSPPWIGSAYPNVDSDGDQLIDGAEQLYGTNPSVFDTDGDGVGDGAEAHTYDLESHSYRDPLIQDEQPHVIFIDGFESGGTHAWS